MKNNNIIEIVSGGTYHSGEFMSIDELNDQYDGRSDIYRSMFLHSDEIKNYYELNKSLGDYCGSVDATELVIDFDGSDLEKVKLEFDKFLRALESNFDVDLKHIRINFSGNKGFHLRIPAVLFGGFEESINLPEIHKQIAIKLTEGFEDYFDESIYQHIHLIRVVNTRNKKSGKIAIPLTSEDFFKFTMEEIQNLASHTRKISFLDESELEDVPLLVELKEKATEEVANKQLSTNKPTAISNKLLKGAAPGKRHEKLTKLVGVLIKMGVEKPEALDLAKLQNQQNQPPKDEAEIEKQVNDLYKRYSKSDDNFWTAFVDDNGKLNIDISMRELKRFLEKKGWGKIEIGKTYLLVRRLEHILYETDTIRTKDFVLNYLEGLDSFKEPFIEDVIEFMLRKINHYFSQGYLETVRPIEVETDKDNPTNAKMYYQNCLVEISKHDGVKMLDYSNLENPIWDSQIINRDFSMRKDNQNAQFRTFLERASGNTDAFIEICSSIGYLLHNYKDRSNAKVVVLYDAKVTDNPSGRTGKSLLGLALSKMRKTGRIDGKNFKFRDSFTFQQVRIEDQIIEFNDVDKGFDFEKLFSVTTDSMWIEYKNETPFEVSFDESPKFVISTNYTVKGNGDSYKDRMFEVAFTDHYNAKHKPKDEFGNLFFDDWDEDEWNRFDNFMLECIEFHLIYGLYRAPESIEKISEKKLIAETSQDFVDFMESEFKYGFVHDKKEVYRNFRTYCGDKAYNPDFDPKQNTFTKWVKIYTEMKGYEYSEKKSNGSQTVKITKP